MPSQNVLSGIKQPKTLEEAAYDALREAITSGGLRPGEKISVNKTATLLGVSRLPVIHALRRLASEGFVEIRPHKTVLVTKPNAKGLRVRYLMLSALEEVALREAWPLPPEAVSRMLEAQQAFCDAARKGESTILFDLQFHEPVWQAPGVEQLYSAIRTLWDQGAYYRHLVDERAGADVQEKRIQDHAAILNALDMETPDAAIAALRMHRERALARLKEHIDG